MKTISKQTKFSVPNETIPFEEKNRLFEKYVAPYCEFIYWICVKHTNSRYYLDDNYNDSLLNLYKYIHNYNPELLHIKSWLLMCTVRHVSMLNKKNAPINSYDLSQIPDDGWYYDVEFSKKEDYLTNYKMLFSDRVLWALDRLSPEMRETLLLSLAGYRMQEIAVISHRSGSLDSKNVETVRSRYHGAKKRMRYLLSIYRE